MSNVTRYDNDKHGNMFVSDDGEFVEYSEWDDMCDINDRLRVELEDADEQIQKLEETLNALRAGD